LEATGADYFEGEEEEEPTELLDILASLVEVSNDDIGWLPWRWSWASEGKGKGKGE
jgi:hypothetical protein